MSGSKFAIKRLKVRTSDPKVWDAAHDLAKEWNIDLNKILYADAEWRVLNTEWTAAWKDEDFRRIHRSVERMLISCVNTKQYTAARFTLPFFIYGHYVSEIENARIMNERFKSIRHLVPESDPLDEKFPYPMLCWIAQAAQKREAVKQSYFASRTLHLLQSWEEHSGISHQVVWDAFEHSLEHYWPRLAETFLK